VTTDPTFCWWQRCQSRWPYPRRPPQRLLGSKPPKVGEAKIPGGHAIEELNSKMLSRVQSTGSTATLNELKNARFVDVNLNLDFDSGLLWRSMAALVITAGDLATVSRALW